MVALSSIYGLTATADKAVGTLTVASLPAADSTITINGVAFTFKASSGGATEITIGASTTACATNIATILNASVNGSVDDATYTASGSVVTVTHDTAGSAGEAFTLASSSVAVVRSAATLEMPSSAEALNAIPSGLRSSDFEKAVLAMVTLTQSIVQNLEDPATDKAKSRRQRHMLKHILRHLSDNIPTATDSADNRAALGEQIASRLLKKFGRATRSSDL